MRLSRFKKMNWAIAVTMIATTGILVTSCSKDKNTNLELDKKLEGTRLILKFSGINETTSKVGTKSSVNNKTNNMQVHSFGDVDVVTSVDDIIPLRNNSTAISKKASSQTSGIRAATAIDGDVTCRIFLINQSTNAVTSEQFTVNGGELQSIAIDPGVAYKWVALSYNNTANIPAATSSLALPENTDVLVATGDIAPVTSGQQPSVSIQFDHAFSRLAIELTSKGIFGKMTNGSVKVSGAALNTGSLNVLTGEITPNATSYTPNIAWSSFASTDAYDDVKVAYLYTAGSQSGASTTNNIQIDISNLAIQHLDGNGSNAPRTYGSSTPITLKYSASLAKNTNFHLKADIVESALSTPGSTAKWARSNLYYSGTPGASSTPNHNPYRFYYENKITDRADGFFAYRGIIPGVFNSRSAEHQDPCALVYPEGLWRQPSLTDIAGPDAKPSVVSLVINVNNGNTMVSKGVGGLLGNTLTEILDLLFNTTTTPNTTAIYTSTGGLFPTYTYTGVEYTTSTDANPAFGEASNKLRFYYNGQVLASSVLQFLNLSDLTVPLGSLLNGKNESTTFWTKDDGLDLGIANVGAWAFYGKTYKPVLGNPEFKGLASTELLSDVGAVGLNVLSTTLKNVRCVRK